ncbi:GTPase domain-containing protein [Planosporangium thailandense]|uniref:GTPase domain-containing protein n=1 Tax=Planosporangium thailandense TaxID=765197 RepID=A0ABX0XS98_9ACTN|nr:GTPase domain-containing protein [Planosporangium thailandense]NJC68880.1 GTPase domain-containing protein [Planosporangium thailandense]
MVAGLTALRETIAGVRYPLALPDAEEATGAAAAIRNQLDDYLLPRLSRLDAPLLVVVGGSTGAGKSTLVNSLVRAPVSAAGVLRPTTRAPVLVCHPHDAPWFTAARLLPNLARTSHHTDGDSLQVISAQGLTPGLAFLDAPDIDSVVDANRALAVQLLAAADLWLFVTTAARYADAVPWELLRNARNRGTAVALVLDRVPPGAADAIGPHLTGMLRANDLGAVPLFVLPEIQLEAGLLPDRVVSPMREWFAQLARSAEARAAVVRQTVDGALAALDPAVEQLAEAADVQVDVADSLAAGVVAAYGDAEAAVDQGVRDGALLRGEVLARWQELVGTGELMRGLQARVGRVRDRVTAAVTGRPDAGVRFQAALGSGLVALVNNAAADAAERVAGAWRVHPAGARLLESAGDTDLRSPSPDLPDRVERLIRDWQRGVLDMVRREAGGRRTVARAGAFAVNATGLAVMASVFVATSFIPTGLEMAVAGGTSVAAQVVLQAVFGDQAIRALADKARADLSTRIHDLLADEAGRFLSVLDASGVDGTAADRLRRAAANVRAARVAAPLAGVTGLPQPTLNGVPE